MLIHFLLKFTFFILINLKLKEKTLLSFLKKIKLLEKSSKNDISKKLNSTFFKKLKLLRTI
jgi:hypothetical protein